ncbi:Thiolase-like [Arabidopsis thaliana x Arabidopsis arenosa]|uniref:3-ketoacyl-CoA synthase n=1 Tax=Arabidopsis thaliana x Arabidopsis arenosa TaxID=1240361 RepID=A0A8T1ZMC4_9BRAS|nr:Thiolase-like [Arabidopsis thaliana x Arabidopsis arenosa]
MEKEATKMMNGGVKSKSPKGSPDFLRYVNMRYVKLGYIYLLSLSCTFCFFIPPLLLLFIFVYRFLPILAFPLSIFFLLLLYHFLTPSSVFLLDFSCYRPPDHLKITKSDFIELAMKSGNFNETAIELQRKVLDQSGIGEESYMPRVVFKPGHRVNLRDGREEAAMVIFGAIDELLAATKINVKHIKILVLNCGVLNTTPSLSAMVINHYKLRHNTESYNLGGMGCSAGIIAIDLAKDLLNAHQGSYALVVSTEIVSFTWYSGNDVALLPPNCFFRMGAAAVMLSSRRIDRWRAKYQLMQLVRTHKGMDDTSYKSIELREDRDGKQGLYVSRDVMEVGRHALKANIATLGRLEPSFEHLCVLASSKKALDEIQKDLKLTEENMEASRRTLERFGNTSSSSIWYELAYLEHKGKMKRDDRVWQIGFGSGFKCNSVVWKALKNIDSPRHNNPWNL